MTWRPNRRLLPRPTLADRGVVVLVATLSAFIVLGAAAAGSWLRVTADDMAAEVFDDAAYQARQLQVYYSEVGEPAVPAEAATTLDDSLPQPLDEVLRRPRHVVSTTEAIAEALPKQQAYSPSFVSVVGFPDAGELVDLVAGRHPRSGTRKESLPARLASTYDGPRRVWVVEVILEREAAEEMDVRVGTYLDLVHRYTIPPRDRTLLRVSGIYEPAVRFPSALDDVDNARSPAISTLPEFTLVRAAALAADDETVLQATWGPEPEVRWTFDPVGLPDAAQAEAVVDHARRLAVQPWPAVVSSTASSSVTGVGDLASTFVSQRETRDTLAAVVLASLAAAAFALLLAAASVLELRRRAVSDVLRARGAGLGYLAAVRGGEALLVCVPGLLAVILLVSGDVMGWEDLGPALVAAVACVVLLTTAQVAPWRALPERLREPMGDALQVVGVLLAVGAVAALLWRDRLEATDPLLLALPALVGLGATVLVVRAVRRLTGVARKLAARSRSLTPLVGSGQAGATARHVMLPVVAVVLAVCSALLALSVPDTLRRGADLAAWRAVGADVLVTGGQFDAEAVRQVRSLPGVSDVAEVHVLEGLLATSTGRERVTVLGVEPDAVRRVTGGAPDRLVVPGSAGPGLDAVVSTDLDLAGDTVTLQYAQAEVPVTVESRLDLVPGVATGEFVMVDVEGLRVATDRRLLRSQAMLLTGSPDVERLRDLVRETWPEARVDSRSGVAAGTLRDPVLARTLLVGTATAVAAAVVAVLAVGLAVALGRPRRRRTRSVLHALGASRLQQRWVSALELVPVLVAAGLAAAGCALLLMAVTGRGLDLASMTDAPVALGLALSTRSWIVAGAVLVAVVVAAAAASAGQGRSEDSTDAPEEGRTR